MPLPSHANLPHTENRQEINADATPTLNPQPGDKAPFMEPILLKRGSISTLTTTYGIDSAEIHYSPPP